MYSDLVDEEPLLGTCQGSSSSLLYSTLEEERIAMGEAG